jgi:hypothetical protein
MQGKKTILTDKEKEQIEKLAAKFWTKPEIAAFMGMSANTFKDNFDEIYVKGREAAKGRLRDLQLQSAIKGNVTMQIWLGKQYLGQSDKQEIDTKEEDNITIILKRSE